jgi:hypothetical protein
VKPLTPKVKKSGRRRIEILIDRYDKTTYALKEYKAKHLPIDAKVTVDCARYKGLGWVVYDHQCPPNQVAVLLPGGNRWRYDILDVRKGWL